ncbi:hypothetical protein [Halomicrobium zhouii]|uniref:hypothetical protein n=1 Tax=Halomicrobium zhouii TaxID=767519 RepID=UPI000B7E968B|nr:hypothetical protein [Halomicrobium zhouii]
MARNDNYDDDATASGSLEDESVDDPRLRDDAGTATGDDVARATAQSDDEMVYAGGREADDGWLTRGLAWALLLTGLALFLFPEPATSMLGIGLIVAGLVVWVVSAA